MQKQYADSIVHLDVIIIFNFLLNTLHTEYDQLRVMKQSERGSVSLLRHRQTGKKFVCRQFIGNALVYRSLLQFSCSHLPQIIEVAEKDGQVLVLEEYIQGDTLSFLLEGDVFSLAQARRIGRQLCQALWVLHAIGAVHRDVKPENVLLRGSDAVLIDFDASRIHKPELQEDTQVLGTTGYAAPEQYGLSQTDHRADIYSMGVLLNVLVTGHHPSQKLARGHMGRIIQKCTMTAPEKRYQTIQALMEAL